MGTSQLRYRKPQEVIIPNLEYDPRNPSDLLGNPLHEGDTVAWGTTWARSPALCIARIEKFRFLRKNPQYPSASDKVRIECPRVIAEEYQLVLRPIKSTGDITWHDKVTGKPMWLLKDADRLLDPDRYEAKTKIINHVKNVVKINVD